jgi:hypothetical protein
MATLDVAISVFSAGGISIPVYGARPAAARLFDRQPGPASTQAGGPISWCAPRRRRHLRIGMRAQGTPR